MNDEVPGYPREQFQEDLLSIDEKPNHGSPDYARDVAFQKIANRVAGTRVAAEKLGVSCAGIGKERKSARGNPGRTGIPRPRCQRHRP